MYKLLFSVVLGRVPAEDAHRLGFGLIRGAAAVPGVSWLLRRWLAPGDPVLRVQELGLDLPGPLGLAAGFDKDALDQTRWARWGSHSSRLARSPRSSPVTPGRDCSACPAITP
jgi:hypothetical protein